MLLIVTLVLTALTLSGAALLTLMKTEQEATFTRGREELVRGVARSAVVYLSACVERVRRNATKKAGSTTIPNYFAPRNFSTEAKGAPIPRALRSSPLNSKIRRSQARVTASSTNRRVSIFKPSSNGSKKKRERAETRS